MKRYWSAWGSGALALVLMGTAAAQKANLLANPSFDTGLGGVWSVHNAEGVTAAAADGAFHLFVPSEAAVGWPLAAQAFAADVGDVFEVTARVRGEALRDGYGAYLSVDYKDKDGERISYTQSPGLPFDAADWTTLRFHTVAPAGVAEARVGLILHGRGSAWFDDVSVRRVDRLPIEAASPETVALSRAEAESTTLYGFGVEDDGWFYGPDNAARGVDEEDLALREARIRWMDPDVVRMFFWIKDWCPSGDWETFTFDSPNMLSHYRTLDVYEAIGAKVIVTGVEWGFDDPYDDVAGAAAGIVALLEHLVRVKGYTCVQGWTLTNEPDIGWLRSGSTFDEFVELHRRVKAGIAERGLDIAVFGSDEALGLPWFERCVTDGEYAKTVDVWASHGYFKGADRMLGGPFVASRERLIDAHAPKPFVVTEFGFQGARSSHKENPLMGEYDYALWAASFAIDGLNAGAEGFVIWCLQAMQYPGTTFMNYGLWDYKDGNWAVRPAYHAWALFCRLTEAGDAIVPWTSSEGYWVKAVEVGDTVFWVNRSEAPVMVHVPGDVNGEVYAYEREALRGDRYEGRKIEGAGATFRAPARSFGYIE